MTHAGFGLTGPRSPIDRSFHKRAPRKKGPNETYRLSKFCIVFLRIVIIGLWGNKMWNFWVFQRTLVQTNKWRKYDIFFQPTTTLYSPRLFWMSLLTLLEKYAKPTITTLGPSSAVATGQPIVPTVPAIQIIRMWEHPGATVNANMSMVNVSIVVKPPPPRR